MRRMFSAVFCVAICFATASTSFGTVVIYTNEASFTAALQPGYNLETFPGYTAWQSHGPDLDFGTGSYAWHAHNSESESGLWTFMDGTLTVGQSDAHILMTFGSGVTAVGGNFTADSGAGPDATDIRLTLADATTVTTSLWGFVGFTSPGAPIVSLDVWCPGGWPVFPTIDNVYTGSAKSVTLITLTSFNATPGFGKVILAWETAAEIDNAGFNILRAKTENGDYIKINEELISAQGSSVQGASYEFLDTTAKNGKTYWYKLQDVDFGGTTSDSGPIKATPRWFYGMFQ